MSDIDDILNEYHAPAPTSSSQGVGRYIPDPAEFARGNAETASAGWQGLKDAGNQFLEQGATPSVAYNAAMSGLQYLSAPFVGAGKYLGGPVERGISDLTGSPTAGKVVGDTVALAPAMFAPFPGVKPMQAVGEGVAGMMGEAPAFRSAVEGIATKWGARSAGSAASQGDAIDDLLSEYEEGAVRKTSHQPKAPEDWYRAQFKGGGDYEGLPPSGYAEPKDVRLLNKGNPAVGERKYAAGENKEPISIQGYQDAGSRPTLRTGHMPRTLDEPTAPMSFYENAFRRELESSAIELGNPPSQMPLLPEAAPHLADMNVQRMQENKQLDPNLLAELKLKFGGGSPQGGADPAWSAQQNAGVRPQAVPFPGAQSMDNMGAFPTQPPNPNVLFPSSRQPNIPMGKEARGNTDRLYNDLGLEPPTKAEPKPAPRGPTRPPPVTVASADKDVTRYGDVEVGRDYDIVHAVGANEMRATGGKVKELVTVNEPVVKDGKNSVQPTAYAVLEDGRRVPAKMLQPTSNQPKIAAMGQPNSNPAITPKRDVPAASTEETADPAFKNVQAAMAKKAAPRQAPEEVSSVVAAKSAKSKLTQEVGKTIKQLLDGKFGGKLTDDKIREVMPGATRAQIDKAVKELQATSHPRLNRATGDDGVPFLVMKKATPKDRTQDSSVMRSNNFAKGIANIVGDRKAAYLHDISPIEMSTRGKVATSPKTMVEKINELILTGRAKVYPEGEPEKRISQISAKHFDRNLHDHDFTIEFTESGNDIAKSFKQVKKKEE